MCKKCGNNACCGGCNKQVISKLGLPGKRGTRGASGKGNLIVRDAQGVPTIVSGVKEIRFIDPIADVIDLGNGVVSVSLVPASTVWVDMQNMPWFVSGSESFRPQYTLEGNKISFRGLLYVPLSNGGSLVNVANGNSYLGVASCAIHAAAVEVISNANSNNGTPQGRFLTSDVSLPNLPLAATPSVRDIVFNDVPCYRRYSVGTRVAVYRSYCDIRIGATNTVFKDGLNVIGAGCVMVFSPFNKEYDGSGTPPLGNDPLGLAISRVTTAVAPADYIAATDNNPFTIGAGGSTNPFSCNAHHINELGGFIFNLDGLSGYLN